jgi:predicted 2-oxoglutarate/Fe(II)-dependent dioxygenase YbiX
MFNELHHGIWEFENALSPEDCETLLASMDSCEEKFWFWDNADSNWYGKTIQKNSLGAVFSNVITSLHSKINFMFEGHDKIIGFDGVQRYREGEGLGKHRDNAAEADSNNIYGVVIYLNDNFSGGNIYYDSDDVSNIEVLSIKPKSLSLVVHRSDISHGVRPVISGTRYVITGFVKSSSTTVIKEELLNVS